MGGSTFMQSLERRMVLWFDGTLIPLYDQPHCMGRVILIRNVIIHLTYRCGPS